MWCLYGYETKDEIIPNKQIVNSEPNKPITVQVEMIIEKDDKQYKISKSQVFKLFDKSGESTTKIQYKNVNNKDSKWIYIEDSKKFIQDFFPKYIYKYIFLNNEEYRNLSRECTPVIFDFVKDLKHDKSINVNLETINALLNEYTSYFFKNISKKEYLKTYIDAKYQLHILNNNGEDTIGLGNTEVCVCSSISIIFAIIKIYEKLKNMQLFIVLEDFSVELDEICSIRFLSTLASAFHQVIFISSDRFSNKDSNNKSLLPYLRYANIPDDIYNTLSNCVSEQYYIKYIHHSKIIKM